MELEITRIAFFNYYFSEKVRIPGVVCDNIKTVTYEFFYNWAFFIEQNTLYYTKNNDSHNFCII